MKNRDDCDELLRLADEEIRQLKERIVSLEQVAQAVEALSDENARLYQFLSELAPPSEDKGPFNGRKIAIIGHEARERDYKLVVERLGGALFFASARGKLGLVDRAVQKADATVYLTSWGNHKSWDRASGAAERYGKPIWRLDQPGLESVERFLLNTVLVELESRELVSALGDGH